MAKKKLKNSWIYRNGAQNATGTDTARILGSKTGSPRSSHIGVYKHPFEWRRGTSVHKQKWT